VRFSLSFAAFFLALSVAPSLRSQAPASPGCTLDKSYYHCDQQAFLATLKQAKTATVESRPFDQATTNSLDKLVRTLNKTEVSGPADLSFILNKTQAEGINYGPSGRELASLLVYSNGQSGAGKQLIWVETFDGEPDLAWGIVVYDILRQFKTNLK
jgi:hypothetical protein